MSNFSHVFMPIRLYW